MLAFTEELHALIVAPYPLVNLVTFEEERVTAMVTQLASAMKRRVAVWRPESTEDPAADFDQNLERWTSLPNGTLVLAYDAHPYLSDPARVRRLRAATARLMGADITLFLVTSDNLQVPEIAKDLVTAFVPLPDREELLNILQRALPEGVQPTDFERTTLAALGLTAREALRAFRRAAHLADLASARGATFDWEGAVVSEKRRLMASAGALEFHEGRLNLDAVGGLDELKSWVDERRRAFSHDARAFGLPQPRGLLMLGVQGCGKSLAAKALAGYWGLPLLRLDLGALFSGDVAAETALRAAERAAEAMAPCVLWCDEIEKGFGEGDAETSRVLGSLLTWLQEKEAPVFFVATANSVESLPPELLRRGRFDEIFFVDLPDLDARRSILEIHVRARGRQPSSFDLTAIAQQTVNFSGAELEQVIVAAMYTAFAEERDLSDLDMVGAARQLVPLYELRETEIKALRAWAKDRARPAGHDRKLVDLFGP